MMHLGLRCSLLLCLLLACISLHRLHADEESDMMAQMMGGKQFGRGKDKKEPVAKADLQYIRCGVCEGIVKHAIAATKRGRSEATAMKKFYESDILEQLEEMCDPDTETGEWITDIDLQERGDKLQLVEMPNSGECGSECRTIARACTDITEEADLTEISEALWAGATRSELSQKLCRDLTPACRKKPPPLPKDRAPGPAFQELGEQELSMRKTVRGLKKAGMSGTMYDRENMMEKMGKGGGGDEAGGMGGMMGGMGDMQDEL